MNPAPAYCHRCGRQTPTVFLSLAGGLVGNCCAVCRACRKGRPYVSRREYEQQATDAREGRRVEHEHCCK